MSDYHADKTTPSETDWMLQEEEGVLGLLRNLLRERAEGETVVITVGDSRYEILKLVQD